MSSLNRTLDGPHRPDRWLRGAQWATWLVALAVMVNAYTHGPLREFMAKRPVLTVEQGRLLHNQVYAIGDRARALGEKYDAAAFGRDQRQLLNIRKIAAGVVVPSGLGWSDYEGSVMNDLYQFALQNEQARYLAETHDLPAAERYAQQVMMGAGQANAEFNRNASITPIPGLPVPPDNPFPWATFWHFYLQAWFLSLFPATVCIVLRFRGRYSELAAEFKDRPWVLVPAIVFWWFGAYAYNGVDKIRRDFEHKCWDFQKENGFSPTPEIEQELWRRAASPYVGGYAKAAELVQRYPQLVAHQSRRAAFVGVLAATIGTPIQAFLNVVTAYASTVRLTPAVAMVDTTNRRIVTGRSFGVMSYNRDKGFGTPTIWGIGQLKQGPMTADAWVDFMAPKVMQASATLAVTDQIGLEAGRVWTPVTLCLPGPDNGLSVDNTIGSYFPKSTGDGLALHASSDRLTFVASAQSGLDPTETDGDVYAKAKSGPVTLYTGGHVGTQKFGFGMLELAWRGWCLREIAVTRPDHDQRAVTTDLVYRQGQYRTGLHLEHDRQSLSVERMLDLRSRLVAHLSHIDGVAGVALTGKVQYGFALAP